MTRRGSFQVLKTRRKLILCDCSARIRLSVKIRDEYRDYKELPPSLISQQGPVGPSRPGQAGPTRKMITAGGMFCLLS